MPTISKRRPVEFQFLGAHPMLGGPLDGASSFFDAFDCVVTLDDGSRVVLGIRTSNYIASRRAGGEEMWGDYRPLPITLDFSTVRFWDFDATLWIGPDPTPCLVYSNAQGISSRGIELLLAPPRECSLLDGPNGTGLPHPEELGIVVPSHARRFALGPQPREPVEEAKL